MIHTGNPFLPEPGDRDQARRFRGRLAAGVTIVTAGSAATATGLTVSSLLIVEGDPAEVHMLVGPGSDLWSMVGESRAFVVHICREGDRRLADVFAGLAPSPGGPFASTTTTPSKWGPVLDDLPDRIYCRYVSRQETGWSGLLVGTIERVEVTELTDPLIHFRSRYHRLAGPT